MNIKDEEDFFYKLDENKNVVPCSMYEWNDYRKNGNIFPGRDVVNGHLISTVLLGINHQFGEGAPLYFETLVFPNENIGVEIYMDRYTTWDEAVAGHKNAIKWVKDGCRDE